MATDVDQTSETTRVAREYFEALGRARARCPAALLRGRRTRPPPRRPRARRAATRWSAFFAELFDAFPDWRFDGPRDRGRGRRRGGALARPRDLRRARQLHGLRAQRRARRPRGRRPRPRARRADRAIDAYMNGAELARQLGALPPQGSATEERMAKAFNLTHARQAPPRHRPRARGRRRLGRARRLPDKEMNVYLVRDGDGVMLFDAGIKAMTGAVAAAGASLGGITRVAARPRPPRPPRGGARTSASPVLCHADNREDAEGDGGMRYFDFSKLKPYAKPVFPYLLKMWDGGPGRRSPTRWPRATRSPASRSSLLPGPRAGPHRPVARGRPPGAGQRLLLHARSADRPPRPPARPPRAPSTSTPSRRAPRSASSRRWSRPPRGRATPSR